MHKRTRIPIVGEFKKTHTHRKSSCEENAKPTLFSSVNVLANSSKAQNNSLYKH